MRRAMMQRCLRSVVVIDSRKWGETAPFTYAQPQEVGRIISDDGAPPELVEHFRALGVTVDLVPGV